jgi:hypothetical protein
MIKFKKGRSTPETTLFFVSILHILPLKTGEAIGEEKQENATQTGGSTQSNVDGGLPKDSKPTTFLPKHTVRVKIHLQQSSHSGTIGARVLTGNQLLPHHAYQEKRLKVTKSPL